MTGSKPVLKSSNSGGKGMDAARRQSGSPVDGSQRKSTAPRAWQTGTNPITQRTSSSNAANGVVNGSRQNTPSRDASRASQQVPNPEKEGHEKLKFLLANFTGSTAVITTKAGEQYSGIFSNASMDLAEPSYVLKMVKRLPVGQSHQVNGSDEAADDYLGTGDDHSMTFHAQDVVDVDVANVHLSSLQNRQQNGFRTDTDISGNLTVREKTLQRWDDSPVSGMPSMALDNSADAGWDQFETNRRLYGVESSYDENLYTTSIDRNDPLYKKRAAEADKLAREIEGSTATNAHVAEERGTAPLDDSGLDEEEKYSGVRRDYAPLEMGQSNKYTPPARRPPTGQPGTRGVPVDPAIISSQLSRTGATPTKLNDAESPVVALPSNREQSETAVPKDSTSDTSKNQDETSTTASKPPSTSNAKSTTATPASATTSTAAAATAGSSKDKVKGESATENIEQNLLQSFRDFSAKEKLRSMEQQRKQQKLEKSNRLAELKKFADNFKLDTPVPRDLVPILAKDKKKQEEIVLKAQKQAAEQKVKSPPVAPASTSEVRAQPIPPIPKKPESSVVSPSGPAERSMGRTRQQQQQQGQQQGQQGGQQQSGYNAGPMRGQGHMPMHNQQHRQPGNLSQRLNMNQQHHRASYGVPPVQLQDLHIPQPSMRPVPGGKMTPNSASSRFNAAAIEFKPTGGFTPSGPSSSVSPRVESVARPPPRKAPVANFLGTRKIVSHSERPSFASAFNPVKRMSKEVEQEGKQKDFATNGGIPQAYRTPPTWDVSQENEDVTYVDIMEKTAAPYTMSPAPNSPRNNMPMPQMQHQLPLHLQQGGPMPHNQQTPSHTPRHYPVQPHGGPPHPYDEHRMQHSFSQQGMQPSPRYQQPPIAYQQSMTPTMAHQFVQMPPGALQYGASPSGQHPQVVHMQMHPGTRIVHPQMQQVPQGGHMMVQQPSQGGTPYMSPAQHIPQQPQMYAQGVQMVAQPQFGGMPPQGYASSPRPVPMSAQSSQQGHVPQMAPLTGPQGQVMYVQPGMPGPQAAGIMFGQHPGQMPHGRQFQQQPHFVAANAHQPHGQHSHHGQRYASFSGPTHVGTPQQAPPMMSNNDEGK